MKSIVRIGGLYVRDYPERFQGDFTLTPERDRAATFHVEDLPAKVAGDLTDALGVEAEILDADKKEGKG